MVTVKADKVERWVTECRARVLNYARCLCGWRREDAEDLASVAIAEWLDSPSEVPPPFVQMRMTVQVRYLDLLRRKETQNHQMGEQELDLFATGDRTDGFASDVRRTLNRLPREEGYVLWAVYGEGFSVEEVGSQLGVSSRTVKRWLAKAKARFMSLYED